MANPRFRAIVATRRKRVAWASPIDWKVYVNHDRLLDFSRAVTGTLFFIPAASLLDELLDTE